VGAGGSAEPALLKTSRRRVFAPSSATGPQLFESTRPHLQKAIKTKSGCLFVKHPFLVGAGGFEPCANYFVSKIQFLYKPKNRVFKRVFPVFRCLRSNLQHIRFYILAVKMAVNTTTIFLFFCFTTKAKMLYNRFAL
jgi:hypothetical protein